MTLKSNNACRRLKARDHSSIYIYSINNLYYLIHIKNIVDDVYNFAPERWFRPWFSLFLSFYSKYSYKNIRTVIFFDKYFESSISEQTNITNIIYICNCINAELSPFVMILFITGNYINLIQHNTIYIVLR